MSRNADHHAHGPASETADSPGRLRRDRLGISGVRFAVTGKTARVVSMAILAGMALVCYPFNLVAQQHAARGGQRS